LCLWLSFSLALAKPNASDELKMIQAETEAVTKDNIKLQEEVEETLKVIEMKNEDLRRTKISVF
jgi:hypothetical protein